MSLPFYDQFHQARPALQPLPNGRWVYHHQNQMAVPSQDPKMYNTAQFQAGHNLVHTQHGWTPVCFVQGIPVANGHPGNGTPFHQMAPVAKPAWGAV